MPEIVEGVIARKKFAIVCTNALLLEKKIDQFQPSPYFTWSIHLDGDREMHDRSVCQEGVYDRAVAALKLAKAKGFRVTINCTFFNNADAASVARFFDTVTELGVDGITVSPGYAYERAPDQQHFLNRTATKELFRDVFRRGRGGRQWAFNQSGLFLDFLAGNQTYHCTPWGNPTRTVFGWQRPCYLLGEGYAKTFKELMDETDWDSYGTGNYEKCADCMVHSRLRGDCRQGHGAPPLEGGAGGLARRRARKGRWRRTSRSRTSARPNTCSQGTSPSGSPRLKPPRPKPGPSAARTRPKRAKAALASRARRGRAASCAGRAARLRRIAA